MSEPDLKNVFILYKHYHRINSRIIFTNQPTLTLDCVYQNNEMSYCIYIRGLLNNLRDIDIYFHFNRCLNIYEYTGEKINWRYPHEIEIETK